MIVNPHAAGWQVIHQQAHGLLAVQLAYHWHPDHRPERWVETLIAVTEHDDGQVPPDAPMHLNEAGAPRNYDDMPFSMEQIVRIAELSQRKGRWVALLISMHLSFLYEPMRGDRPELDDFLDEQKTRQQTWRRALGLRKADAQRAYALMKWCDQFSLILCTQALPAGERALEIEIGPDGQRYEVVQRADGTLAVSPWPFATDRFSVHVEAACLEQLRFDDPQQLRQALDQATIETLRWELVR